MTDGVTITVQGAQDVPWLVWLLLESMERAAAMQHTVAVVERRRVAKIVKKGGGAAVGPAASGRAIHLGPTSPSVFSLLERLYDLLIRPISSLLANLAP